MTPSSFEAVKVAIKQDKSGYILTLAIHPDEIPSEVMRDFVGARYQVVMVRLNGEEKPMDREKELPSIVKLSALLCKDEQFHKFLFETGQIFSPSEKEATDWLREECQISSRSELATNQAAAKQYNFIYKEFSEWKKNV